MKKIILVLVMVLLLSGCNVNYGLRFENEQLMENVKLTIDNNQEYIDELKNTKAYAIFDGMGKEEYHTTFKNNKDTFEANYDYTYDLDNFNRNYYISQCFDAISFVRNGDKYIFTSTEGFKCMIFDYIKIDNVEVSITTNHEVISHNATKVKGNKYIWNINDENADKMSINMVFGQVKRKSLKDYFYEHPVLISSILVLTSVGIGYIVVTIIKSKKNKEI